MRLSYIIYYEDHTGTLEFNEVCFTRTDLHNQIRKIKSAGYVVTNVKTHKPYPRF